MNRSHEMPWYAVWLPALVIAAMAAQVRAADVVYLTNGKSIAATKIEWRESDQEYRVESEGTIIPVPKAQVDHLEIAKPPELDGAIQKVAAGQYDPAIPVLEDITGKYKMLVWDDEARRWLAVAYLGKNDAKKAVTTLDEIFVNTPKEKAPLDVLTVYWKALLAADRSATLKKDLETAIASGSPETAAAAQLMRGDMNRRAGLKEDALLDYLRTVILFEQVKAVQPEALFKAAEVLDELRDPRADTLRKKLLQEFGDSPYAKKLGGKM